MQYKINDSEKFIYNLNILGNIDYFYISFVSVQANIILRHF